jgi:Lar family restriction alleviation protein
MNIDTSKIKLKNCPFCGSKWTQVRYINNPFDKKHVYGGYRAECCDCYVTTKACKTPEEAAALWNNRPDDSADKMTYKDIMLLFSQRYNIKIKDYRPASDMYVPYSAGITVWTEEGDTLLFFPKELEEETDNNK